MGSATPQTALAGDRDALHAALGSGRSAAHRSLVLFDIDHSSAVAPRIRASAISTLIELAGKEFGPGSPIYGHSRDGIAVLSDLIPAEATLVAEHVRAAFAARTKARGGPGLTVSAGVAGPPTRRGDMMLMLWSAESALVRAKETGRDKIAVSPGDTMIMKSTYYPRALLERLSAAARGMKQPEAVILRDALERYLREQEERQAP